ncbi:MAG: ATP-binding cassette domain-containing protein [Acetobacteraceae bacterium]|nr:ATP-binding cassette domain-containing protein [Acetobacteraceae bacterium]
MRAVSLRSAIAGPFDLSLGAGECIALSGPSGSGKTLFLRMLADLDPNQGEVFLDERERRTFAPSVAASGLQRRRTRLMARQCRSTFSRRHHRNRAETRAPARPQRLFAGYRSHPPLHW